MITAPINFDEFLKYAFIISDVTIPIFLDKRATTSSVMQRAFNFCVFYDKETINLLDRLPIIGANRCAETVDEFKDIYNSKIVFNPFRCVSFDDMLHIWYSIDRYGKGSLSIAAGKIILYLIGNILKPTQPARIYNRINSRGEILVL
jgi:hypothetical protein